MSYKTTVYVAKESDAQGYVHYDTEENRVWEDLIIAQREVVKNRACHEYLQGLEALHLLNVAIPQCHAISATLTQSPGWCVEPVSALIPANTFSIYWHTANFQQLLLFVVAMKLIIYKNRIFFMKSLATVPC